MYGRWLEYDDGGFRENKNWKMMKRIIIESHVPYVGDAFQGVADAIFLPPEEITPEAVREADALIVRTRTRCDASLLEGSRVRFVATATIGTDHIDLDYCRRTGIEVVSAPGCNAPAVAQYVWSSILRLRPDSWRSLVVGIVGLGHVGAIVADWARQLGVTVLACDPPRCREHGGWDAAIPYEAGKEPFVSLREIAGRADVVTFHTPHTTSGTDATHHLADSVFFASLERCPLVINAARGPIVDTEAILSAIKARCISGCVIDCWEGEPAINGELLGLADIATPHIAGYSIEGKQRATRAVVTAALRFFGCLGRRWHGSAIDTAVGTPGVAVTAGNIIASYDPFEDSARLKSSFTPAVFENMRNSYHLRHELGFA